MMYETILSPINYGGMQLKNRIIFAPTTFGLSDEEYLAKLRAIAQGGCAMIIVGDVPVGKSKFEKSLFDAKGFAFYQQVVKIAHDADCKVCAQLHQSDSNLLAMFKYIPGVLLKKITPDQLREKLNAEVAPYITNMSQRKIHEIISGFGKAAALAKQAGFDMMQVHGDRMCGSFSSAIFNHRTDEYGGSAENRARFAAEAVSAVHAAVPGMPIDYKLAVRQENPHFGNAGVVEEELPVFVPLLEQAGRHFLLQRTQRWICSACPFFSLFTQSGSARSWRLMAAHWMRPLASCCSTRSGSFRPPTPQMGRSVYCRTSSQNLRKHPGWLK